MLAPDLKNPPSGDFWQDVNKYYFKRAQALPGMYGG